MGQTSRAAPTPASREELRWRRGQTRTSALPAGRCPRRTGSWGARTHALTRGPHTEDRQHGTGAVGKVSRHESCFLEKPTEQAGLAQKKWARYLEMKSAGVWD